MDGTVTIGLELETKEFDQQILAVERRMNEIEKELSTNAETKFLSSEEVDKLNLELEKTKNKLVGLYNQKMKLQNSGGFKEMNFSLNDAIKKVGKLTLGIFGIRSAYMLVRRAASELATYDPQFAANLEYIRFVLTQTIAPVLKYIVELAGQLVSYLYTILHAWFGIGSKADVSVDAFKKMKANAKGTSSAVKEIKKDLLGFDEINRLTDNGIAGASGVGIPTFDVLNGEVPEWVKWIADNKEAVLTILGALGALKIGADVISFVDGLGKLTPEGTASLKAAAGLTLSVVGVSFFGQGVKGFKDGVIDEQDALKVLGGILGLGVGVGMLTGSVPLALTVGISLAGYALTAYGQTKTPLFLQKLLGLEDFTDLSKMPGSLDKLSASMVVYISFAVLEPIKNIFSDEFKLEIKRQFLNLIEEVVRTIKRLPVIGDTLGWMLDGILTGIQAMKGEITKQGSKTLSEATSETIENIRDKVNDNARQLGGQAGSNWMSEMKNRINSNRGSLGQTIIDTTTNATNNSKEAIKSNGNEIGNTFVQGENLAISSSVDSIQRNLGNVISLSSQRSMDTASNSGMQLGFREIQGINVGQASQQGTLTNGLNTTVRNSTNNVDTSGSKSIGFNIISGILNGMNNNSGSLFGAISRIGSSILSNFKNILGIHSPSRAMADLAEFIPLGIAEGIEKTSNKAIDSMKNLVTGLEDTMLDADIGYDVKTGLPTIPKQALSTTGIISMPNKGTYSGATTSTTNSILDNSTMAELGREIGKWITINANITNTMNGRVISRELKHIQNEQDFAYNT